MRLAGFLVPALMLGGAALAETPFRLGVQTHFEQGWSLDLLPRLAEVGATLVRDELDWAGIETRPGEYDFAPADAYMAPLAAMGIEVMVVQTGTNPLHDAGNTPHTPEGRAAHAAFLAETAAHYAGQVTRIEIGNEVNAGESIGGPFKQDPARELASLARAAGPVRARAEVLCAGTNTIPMGFLRDFFRAGGLEACDSVSVHPYGAPPETVDLELGRLRALMQEMGGERPVHVTEFGQWTDRPEESAGFLVKSVAALAGAGVGDAIWYALIDEPWWPNMGLFTPQGQIKPAGLAYAFVQKNLIPLGRPTDVSPTRAARIFAYGAEGQAVVAWGAGLPVEVRGSAQAFDATGNPVDLPGVLGDDPVILLGQGIELAVKGAPVHDSLFHYDLPPWSYHARRPDIGLTPLEWRDWQWASFRGAPDLSPLAINANWITTARFGDRPYAAVERFTAPAEGRYRIEGWWQAADGAEPSAIRVVQGGEVLAQGETGAARFAMPPVERDLAEGATVEFEVGPAGPDGDGSVRRRIRIEGPLP